MWESCGRVFIDERRRGGKYRFLNIVFARIIVALKDRKGLVANRLLAKVILVRS
jgi:hypothetical protein